MSRWKCVQSLNFRHTRKNQTALEDQLPLVSEGWGRDWSWVSGRGWGRERGVTTSFLLGVGPSISRSASVFLVNLSISISIRFRHEHVIKQQWPVLATLALCKFEHLHHDADADGDISISSSNILGHLCLLLLPTPSWGKPLFKPARRTQALHTWGFKVHTNANKSCSSPPD